MKKIILWIHGFAANPVNETFKEMKKLYSEYEWYPIEVTHYALDSMGKINDFIKVHMDEIALVSGTSLGGFYAMCSTYDGPKLVINPVVTPSRDLHQFIGHNCYKPGRQDGLSDFEFTEAMLEEFGQLSYTAGENIYCLYTTNDQVLGADIKTEYEHLFKHKQMVDPKILPGHFLTFKFVQKTLPIALKIILHYDKDISSYNAQLKELEYYSRLLNKYKNGDKNSLIVDDNMCAVVEEKYARLRRICCLDLEEKYE